MFGLLGRLCLKRGGTGLLRPRLFSNKVDLKQRSPRKKTFGQPTWETHPHLLAQGEVLPLITLKELQTRREKLCELLVADALKNQTHVTNHVVVIPSASKKYMSDKIPYVFRQNSDYLYLSGCQEADTCLVLLVDGQGRHRSVLFVQDRDAHVELWNGPRTGPDDAVQLFGVDDALPVREFASFVKACADKPNQRIWFDFSASPIDNFQVHRTVREVVTEKKRSWENPRPHLHALRLLKSPAEVELMRRSCAAASDAIVNCMRMSTPGVSEHQLFARVDHECRMAGAVMLAYPPVVAGGERANIIHYISNNQVVNDGEMVLMDAGCEYHGYSSDITRTWPINGTFTKHQQELYEVVLDVQKELLEALKERPTLDGLLDTMYLLLGKRLQEIGIVPKASGQNLIMRDGYKFCPHHVSHYLGMDVHDTPSIPRNIPLQPGMIITVEPGVYINETHDVPPEYRHIGIRIEDDVLITDGDPVVLTERCPKTVSELSSVFFPADNDGDCDVEGTTG